ncbi:MAG: phosphoglycerate kinase [Candidatus Paceibacterota bacterium]|jgi:phosphoglycerate kinase
MQTEFRKIADEKNLRGKRVLLRLDLNVPIVNGEVRDDFRVKRSLDTIRFLRDAGAKTIIMSHIEDEIVTSLSRVAAYMQRFVTIKALVSDLKDAEGVVRTMNEGEVIMLENLRRDPGEKGNNPMFAARLAALGDVYVNDAFAVSHREHASVVSVPRMIPSYAGLLLAEEVAQLSRAFNPSHPFVFLLGGAKFETKLPLIEKFLGIADSVFVGGALANDLFKEKGFEIGKSLISKAHGNLRHVEMNPRLMVPIDVVIGSASAKAVKDADSVDKDDRILDAGPRTIGELSDVLSEAQFALWNGPLGDYEIGFSEGTEGLARALVESGVPTIIGGGDTIAVVSKLGLLDKFSFVSTGGGAMLQFLADGTLPGIEALKS